MRTKREAALAGTCAALALAAFGAVAPAFAAFEDMGAGARAPGMGNAFVAVADDAYAVYYNPAGLGTLERPQFAASYTSLYMGLTDNSSLGTSFIGYAHPLQEGRLGTLATAWNSFSLNTSLYREDSFYLSYGRLALTPTEDSGLYAGVSLKYLRHSFGHVPEADNAVLSNSLLLSGQNDPVLSRQSSRGAFDADLGLLYLFARRFSVGLQMAHLPQPNVAFSPSDSDQVPLGVRLGVDYRSAISNVTAQIDTQRSPTGSRDNILTLAGERWLPLFYIGDFGFRGGLNLGSRDLVQANCGFSIKTGRLTIDYGFGIPLKTIAGTAGSHHFAITMRFGRATEADETVENVLEMMRQLKAGGGPTPAPAFAGLPASTTTCVVVSTPAVPVQVLATQAPAAPSCKTRAETALGNRNYEEAIRQALRCLRENPNDALLWETLGTAYFALKNYPYSLEAWQKAMNLEQEQSIRAEISYYIRTIKILLYKRTKPTLKAAPPQATTTECMLSPEEFRNLFQQGIDYYTHNELDKAQTVLERILACDPQNVEIRNALRRVQEERR